jgi:hypothetical protein
MPADPTDYARAQSVTNSDPHDLSSNSTGTYDDTTPRNAVGGWFGQDLYNAVNDLRRQWSMQRDGEQRLPGYVPDPSRTVPATSEFAKQGAFIERETYDNVRPLFHRNVQQDVSFVVNFRGDKVAAQRYFQWLSKNGIVAAPEVVFIDSELQAAFLQDPTQAQWHHLFPDNSTRSA